METYIEINSIINTSIVDGPGVRTVLMIQGCSMKCYNCHNQIAQSKGNGYTYNIDRLIKKLELICLNKKITISGGEPMEQYSSVLELVRKLDILGFDICIYTGWEINQVPPEIFNYINYIKAGAFINSLKDTSFIFFGSSNQQFFKISKEKELCLIEV